MTLCFHIHLLIQFYELPYDVRREKRLGCITVYLKKFACHHLVAVVDRDGEDRLADHLFKENWESVMFLFLSIYGR